MARTARNKYNVSFFHVIVQGINKEYIFNEERYIYQYLKLLNQYESEYNIIILAYCIMNNHAHLLLRTEKIQNMSKFMQTVNTKYAKYYNYMNEGRVGYVFRDRFLSEPIFDKRYLIKCIHYIHQNPVKALIVERAEDYQYSSLKQYLNEKQEKQKIEILNDIFGMDYKEVLLIGNKNINLFCDIDEDINEILENKILDYMEIKRIKLEDIFMNVNILKELIIYLINTGKNVKKKNIMKKLSISKNKLIEILK